jgi:hypothetical protein
MPGKSNWTTMSTSPTCWEYEHHYQRHSSWEKYCKDNTPRGDHEKKSKIDLTKQDLKDYT